MKEHYFKDIKHERFPNERVCDWEYATVDENIRVYYKTSEPNSSGENGMGFYFYAFKITSFVCVPETENNHFHPEYSSGECIFNGVAYYDGIRHLYYGDELTDNYGYHYYANIESIIRTLKVIRELEKKYCRDYE